LELMCRTYQCLAYAEVKDFNKLEFAAAKGMLIDPLNDEFRQFWAYAVIRQGGVEGAKLLVQQLTLNGKNWSDDRILEALDLLNMAGISGSIYQRALTEDVLNKAIVSLDGKIILARLALSLDLQYVKDKGLQEIQDMLLNPDERKKLLTSDEKLSDWQLLNIELLAVDRDVNAGLFDSALAKIDAIKPADAALLVSLSNTRFCILTWQAMCQSGLTPQQRKDKLLQAQKGLQESLQNATEAESMTVIQCNLAEMAARLGNIQQAEELKKGIDLTTYPTALRFCNAILTTQQALMVKNDKKATAEMMTKAVEEARSAWDYVMADPAIWGANNRWNREEALFWRNKLGSPCE